MNNPFPRTEVAGVSLSRMIIGTNWILGWSHRSPAADQYIKNRFPDGEAVLLAGWLLGGPVGIGTLISTFGAGLVMQLVYSLLRFEPRSLRHQDIVTVTKRLLIPRDRIPG